jgi:hypothetical protein
VILGHVAQTQGFPQYSLTMDNGLKISILLGFALAAIPVSATTPTNLSSKTTTFTGTVPVSCQLNNSVNTVTMSLTSMNLFEGTTTDIGVNSNSPVTLSLSPVTVSATPTGTSSYSWAAALMDGAGGTLLSTTDSSSAASTVDYNNGITNTNFKVRLSVGPASGNVKPGTYTGTVTLDCLSL